MRKKLDKTIPLLILIMILSTSLFISFWYVFNRAVEHDSEKTELISLSNLVLHDNNTLIRNIRNYAVTREQSYREAYEELLADHGSFAGRLERMNEIGLTDVEVEKIALINATWAKLEAIEAGILSDMDDGNYEKAIATVFGDEYLQADKLLAETIARLITNIEERSFETTSDLYIQVIVISVIFSIAYLGLTIVLAVIYNKNSKMRETYRQQKDDFESEAAMLQFIFDSLPMAVRIARSDDFTLMYANKAIVELFGYESVDEVIGRNYLEFLSPEQPGGKTLADFNIKLGLNETYTTEALCVKKTGEKFMTRIAICKIMFKGIPATLATIEDITAEQKYRQKLENVASQEKEANLLKSRFLAMMSHEVRTPMNAILGIAEIQMQDESIPESSKESFERIFESGNLLLNIINDILDLSKIEAGKLEITPVNYDIPSLINDTIQLTRLRYDSSPIDFMLSVDPETPLNVHGDELRVRQVLSNILSNAFKYTKEGKVKLTVSSEISKREGASDNEAIVVFSVSDTGQGMTKEQLSTLFDEYTRFNMEANRTTIGTGLGMSITKRLLDLMHGEISVESEIDMGSTFTVRIPQIKTDDLVCGEEMSEKLSSYRYQSTRISRRSGVVREYMPYGSVLVVDDVESNIYVTSGMLLPYGLKVDTATSGFSAIDKIKAGHEYDIIFMDHMMPKMDGIQTVKKLRDMGYTGSIVALTANALVGQAEMFLQNGFDGYISKPIDSRELNRSLNELIRNKKPAQVVKEARRKQAAMQADSHMRQRTGDTEAAARDGTRTGTGGNTGKQFTEMEEFFLSDAESAMKVFEETDFASGEVGDEAINTYEVAMHGVKSALRNIGEKNLMERAAELEAHAHERDFDFLKEANPEFIGELKTVITKVRKGG